MAAAFVGLQRIVQRHFVLDARHVGVEDLPEPNLVTAVVRLEQTAVLHPASRNPVAILELVELSG